MDQNSIVQQVMAELQKQSGPSCPDTAHNTLPIGGKFTELVGVTPLGDTIGLVLANVDNALREKLELDTKYKSIGILGSRTGAGPQAFAGDEAVKSSNAECVRFEMPRDCKGGPGHGILIVFGAEEVSDARRAVEITLNHLPKYLGGCWANDAGHFECQYTARAGQLLSSYMGAHLGKAFGVVGAGPSPIGILMADTLLKAADVEFISAMSPTKGLSFSNEYIVSFAGDSGAVKQAVLAARDIAYKALGTMGKTPENATTPYL
jgi:microcompartment protein PduB